MKTFSRVFAASLTLSVVLTVVGCAEMRGLKPPMVPPSGLELLVFSWTCEPSAAAGSQTSYGIRLRVSGSGDLAGDLGEEFQLTGGLLVPGAPAGHCQDIGEEAVGIAETRRCTTRGLSYFASTGMASFRASCQGVRADLVRVMGNLLRHAQSFTISTP